MLPTSAHIGINRTYNKIKKYYFWKGLKTDIEKFVKNSDKCQRNNHSVIAKQHMGITTTATVAFDEIFIDLVGSLTSHEKGNQYILTMQCDLSKYIEAVPIINKESNTIAKSLQHPFPVKCIKFSI